ncbi:glycosyltransferase family 10 domain-containing protein [Wenyingzhuangia aestuarii]|uniref:glycosyltransferase family 10 domain-containing protein n=1 Tax=Wenyingzhuangia aestuarii TaxID=1647582 RepID=UPI001439427D|nr:glycosyltransferase family 10 [Wenyingzhuangia aestuarii]NJB81740.1 hypothetical protein [Wenyingzhuangia aestuarii]
MNIKLYRASSLKYTPFDDFVEGDLDYLKEKGIMMTSSLKEADVIVSQNTKHFKKYFFKALFGKKLLIWTTEPRFCKVFTSKTKLLGLVDCNIMNLYTQDIFINSISIHCYLINKSLKPLDNDFKFNSKKTIALMSYYKGINAAPFIRNGENIDLIALRSKIALEGAKLGSIDVFGKGWPSGISKEDSRDGAWGVRKPELLKNYNFNFCFENTATHNYMTEKIWDSISNYCLPIYYGKHTNAYSLFPENSFIDYSKFNSPKELFDYIDNMSSEEFVCRMNKCIDVYNHISSQNPELAKKERKKVLDKIVEKVKLMCH